MTLWLENKVAIVTGSGQGIGRAIAMAMAKEGARVVTNNRKPGTPGGDAETTAREIKDMGGQSVPFFGDISEWEVAHKLVQTAVDNFGQVDILVNNAGVVREGLFIDATKEDFTVLVASHLEGQLYCIKAAAPHMIAQKYGRIIHISSGAALGLGKGQVAYGAVKAGILGLTRCCATEMKEYGITVNAIMPVARTRAGDNTDAEVAAGKVKLPVGLGSNEPPENIAPIVVYLASEKAGKITGRTFARRFVGTIGLMSDPTLVRAAYKDGVWSIDEIDKVMTQLLPEIG